VRIQTGQASVVHRQTSRQVIYK